MNLDPKRLNIICPISTASEIRQVELDLVPALVVEEEEEGEMMEGGRGCGMVREGCV